MPLDSTRLHPRGGTKVAMSKVAVCANAAWAKSQAMPVSRTAILIVTSGGNRNGGRVDDRLTNRCNVTACCYTPVTRSPALLGEVDAEFLELFGIVALVEQVPFFGAL